MPEIPPTTTIGGYAVLVVLAACTYYFVGHQRKNKNIRPIVSKQASKVEPRKEAKSKKSRKDGGQSSGDQAVKSTKKVTKKKTQQAGKSDREDQPPPSARAAPAEKDDDEVDNREFARQLSNAKAGTIVAPKSQAASRPKSVKQTKAQEKANATSSGNLTASSAKSTTGDDADDDESPLNSPELEATAMATPVASGDVSDMLEKPAAGPSVLKINAPTNPSQPKKAKQAKETVVEGKQQKKNRKKAEGVKAAKEQAEVERKQKLELQLKTARVAEGRPAKDGSSSIAAKAPSSSAWTAPAATNGTSSSSAVELLDTYESSSSETPATKQQSGTLFSPELNGTELLTDEEAVARVLKETAEWEEVKTKGKKSRASKAPQEAKETKEVKEEVKPAPKQSATVQRTAQAAPNKDWDAEPTSDSGRGRPVNKKQPVITDSEWVVA